MNAFEYGAVEFYLVGLEGNQVDSAEFKELRTLIDSESMRLLDCVLVAKDVDELDLDRGSLGAAGVVGSEDNAEQIMPFVGRVGRTGLLGLAARTAVVGGTASAVSNGINVVSIVARRRSTINGNIRWR